MDEHQNDLTPMMQQYMKVKNEYNDCLLLYRLGDFYELFFDDAVKASETLDLVLTKRACGGNEKAPMCGVPFHSAEAYIARLVEKGYKIAICDQTEDPKNAKGLVKREVTRLVTKGTLIESSMLDEKSNNFICSVYLENGSAGLCFCDISTGEVYATCVLGDSCAGEAVNELARFNPAEAVLNSSAADIVIIKKHLEKIGCTVSIADNNHVDFEAAAEEIKKRFGRDAHMLNIAGTEQIAGAVYILMNYLKETQKNDLSYIRTLNLYTDGQFMTLDPAARRNLELCETIRTKSKKGSLLWALDSTKTVMGSRLLRSWLEKPLMDVKQIQRRQQACDELMSNMIARAELADGFKGVLDMERITARIAYGNAGPRDMRALCETLKKIPELKAIAGKLSSQMIRDIYNDIDTMDDIAALIDAAIADEPPFSVRDGGFIRNGFSKEVDELRSLISGGRGMLAEIECREREKTGIKNLKVGYNKVFGYYIEVTKSYYDLVPQDYIRKQTLAACERYITDELKQLEGRVLSASERINEIEYDLFTELREKIAGETKRIQTTARAITQLDVLFSFAEVGTRNGYVIPMVDNSDVIQIKDGRHPVVELIDKTNLFVPNDTLLDCNENRMIIITGPNMAGKSTYMRQTALIVIMAQMGAPVPASSARIGICDRVFTRIGASDDLSSGQSTFMVEMSEVAEILAHATQKSLVIFDEIGRGTSTFDGMAIARAALEYTADKASIGAKTLFATHYHELTALEDVIDGVKNYNIAVKKRGDEITFLRKIIRGGADDSYGVAVAKLAGLPERVIERAKDILAQLEANKPEVSSDMRNIKDTTLDNNREIPPFFDEILKQLSKIDLNVLTPIEAMNVLYKLKSCAESAQDRG